jgi:hypothetical protein
LEPWLEVIMNVRRSFLRRALNVLLAVCVIQLVGCGYKSMGNNPSGPTQNVSGTVAAVALTSVNNGSSGLTTATAVTLNVALGTSSLVLCGDQRTSFTSNAAITVSYMNGTYCANLVSVKPA